MKPTLNLLLLMALTLLAGCATRPADVPNLRPVAPGIWRGGQPTEAGWQQLASLGVTNVVKLNTLLEGKDTGARALGMRVTYLPIDLLQQLVGGPDEADIRAAVAQLSPGTFLHCSHGQDRTGLAIACYRLWVCGWSKEAAEKEMLKCGFHKSLHGLWEFWEEAR